MSGGARPVALAESAEQARAALEARPAALIVAISPAVDYWRETHGRTDPTIEDLCDEATLASLGDASVDLVEALADRVETLARPLLATHDPHTDLSLRAYFHYLKANYDGVLIRLEQAVRAFDALHPPEVIAYRMPPWQMSGLSSFDKPAWSLISHLVPLVASDRGIPVLWVEGDGPCPAIPSAVPPATAAAAPPTKATPPAATTATARLAATLHEWRGRLSRARHRVGRRPLLVHSLFGDLGDVVVESWERSGGRAAHFGEFFGGQPVPADAGAVSEKCRALWQVIERDAQVWVLLERHGISLWPFLGPLLREIITECLPKDHVWARQAESAFARQRVVLLSGGMVERNYVIGRAAHRAGSPFVSHHYGGFLGYSELPMHERYDMAECDYFLCGGPEAKRTFATPSPHARWRAKTRRAAPIATGLPWVEDFAVRFPRRTTAPVRRIMVVLNALVGDCRYLGYVFPPEIGYWRFTRRVVERLAREELQIIVKPPLVDRYPQRPSPLEAWIDSMSYENVTLLSGIPLKDCMDRADAFLLEGPSTPLLHVVASSAPLLLYADRRTYRLVPEARRLIARRAAVFAEDEDSFFGGLEGFLAAVRRGDPLSPVDDEFLNQFCLGGAGRTLDRVTAFLRTAERHHPLTPERLAVW